MGEQKYLARFHREKGIFYSVEEDEIDLVRDVEIAKRFKGFSPIHKTTVSVKNFLRVIDRF